MTTSKSSYAQTFESFGLVSCDFVFNCKSGIEFTVYAQGSEPDTKTTTTPLFDYNNETQSEAIKEICLAIVDDGFPEIHNITEVSGSFYPFDGEIIFEGEVTTVLTAECTTIS